MNKKIKAKIKLNEIKEKSYKKKNESNINIKIDQRIILIQIKYKKILKLFIIKKK